MYRDRQKFRDNHPYFKSIVESRRSLLTQANVIELRLLNEAPYYRSGERLMSRFWLIQLFTLIAGAMASYLVPQRFTAGIVAATTLVLISAFLVRASLRRFLCKKRARLLDEDFAYNQALREKFRIETEIEFLWDYYNVNYNGYPPDWHWRKEDVKKRDNYTCANCGWPDGVKSKRRNLHVHHRVPLSRGGNNALTNLITLCHMCHNDEEGPGHGGFRYTKRAR